MTLSEFRKKRVDYKIRIKHSKIKKNECSFYIKENGKFYKCDRKLCGGIVRCNCLCTTHFWRLKLDNLRRIEKGIDIPNSFDMLKIGRRARNLCVKEIKKPRNKRKNI